MEEITLKLASARVREYKSNLFARGVRMGSRTSPSHHHRVKKEFTRQAKSMQESLIFTNTEILKRIRSAVLVQGDDSCVLDLGCGPGILTTAIGSSVTQIVALDITPQMIEQARAKSQAHGLDNVHFTIGAVENLPFQDHTFDVIVTRLTLHHFHSPLSAIAEMIPKLRDGGRLVIADIVSSENREEAELHNALEILRDPSHVKMLSLQAIRDLVESLNLTISDIQQWRNEREFQEWVRITNAPERIKPLYMVMKNLAETGLSAGINLRFTRTTVAFDHHWVLITVEKPQEMI
jgi:ubiquinone/menaquinone biosynthesis C-methylase UbiE